jgi:hypothetical protein
MSAERLLGDLVAASHLMSMEQIPGTVARHAARAGLHDVRIYVADLQQRVLRLLTALGEDAAAEQRPEGADIRIEGTLAGRAFTTTSPAKAHAEEDGFCQCWVPILDGTERVGVMRVTLPDGDEEALLVAENLAGLVALLIVSRGPASDSLSRLVRTREMSVSAEMQWRLMPPMTFANDQVVIGAALEPAYMLGGDSFDYALAGDTAYLAIFDAMGHDTASGLTSTLAVAACRNSRLQGTGLVGTGRAIEEALAEQDKEGRFVTAVLARLDLSTGDLTWVSYGHPAPVVIRQNRSVTELECAAGTPLGTGLGIEPEVCAAQLEPGDRLVLYSDGIVEARDPRKREFGLDRFIDFIIRHEADGLPVPETLRRLVHSILEHHEGRLDDDATVLLLEWHGPPGVKEGIDPV